VSKLSKKVKNKGSLALFALTWPKVLSMSGRPQRLFLMNSGESGGRGEEEEGGKREGGRREGGGRRKSKTRAAWLSLLSPGARSSQYLGENRDCLL
jgi:hypothetical protein